MENYVSAFELVVKFANEHCLIVFEPESEYPQDLIDPILSILNNQKATAVVQSQVTPKKMTNFLQEVLKRSSFLLPYSVKKLKDDEMKKLVEHCDSLAEIMAIFSSCSAINPAYRDKENYVIKRLYDLIQDEKAYSEGGFDTRSRLNTPTFGGRLWQLGEHPSDPEIVASVFCSVLNYAVQYSRPHLYDFNLSRSEVAKFKRSDITMFNTQPSSIFRAHFEVYVGNDPAKVCRTRVGSMNLWYACMWMYAAIYKLHKGKYGSFDCTDAIEFIFGTKFLPKLDVLDFY